MFGRGFKESAPHNKFIKNFRIPIVEEIVIDLQKIYHKFNKSCLLWSDCNTCVCKHRDKNFNGIKTSFCIGLLVS